MELQNLDMVLSKVGKSTPWDEDVKPEERERRRKENGT